MARTSVTSPAEALAGMARVGAPREPMGEVNAHAVNASAQSQGPHPRPRKSRQAGDPTAPGTAKHRSAKLAGHSTAHGITARVKPEVPPCAGSTTANGRLMPVVTNRQDPNFRGAIAAAR